MSPEIWSWRQAVEIARERLASRGLKPLAKPTLELETLVFPESVESFSGIALANLSLRYQSWYSYATVELGTLNAERTSFRELFDIKLGEKMHEMAERSTDRMTKDVLRAISIQADTELKTGVRQLIELDQQACLLEALVKGLEIRCRALENEAIRRATAQKLELAGRSVGGL